jgi:type I restriction-modification system DNA methylase subunit
MSVPQYKVNIHVATVLSKLGLNIRAEDPHRLQEKRGIRIPDFTLIHPVVGHMLGEAEVGDWEYDENARRRLDNRVEERFKDNMFKGYDFILLIIYKREDLERLSKLEEYKVEKEIERARIGIGLAVRKDAFDLNKHYKRFYDKPIEVRSIPIVLEVLLSDFFSQIKRETLSVKESIEGLIERIEALLNTYASDLAKEFTKDQKLLEALRGVARKLLIAWDYIRDDIERAKVTFKLLLLLVTLSMLFHMLVGKERRHIIRHLDCKNLTYEGFMNLFDELIRPTGSHYIKYAELDSDMLEALKAVPSHNLLDEAVSKICREVVDGYPLLRRTGWDILSTMYQRMLSETFRHAFATFYTKISAARLLASLAIEKFEDKIIDPASGTGSLLLAGTERRLILLGGSSFEYILGKAQERNMPLLDVAREEVLKRTVGLDALKPAIYMAALNLRIATHCSPPDVLHLYHVPIGGRHAGSLDYLTDMKSLMKEALREVLEDKFDVVIMNPPFTRADRISLLLDEQARRALGEAESKGVLTFGGVRITNIFAAGLAKPFMVLADMLVKEGGRIAAVLPTSILNRVAWNDIREGLMKQYRLEYIVISWAPGTPNFSSDTQFREILLVARKASDTPGTGNDKLKIIGLLKRVDELNLGDIEILSREAKEAESGFRAVFSGNNMEIGFIVVVDGDIVRRFSDNLYGFVAFKNPKLSKYHLELISRSSVRLGELFDVGSAITQTTGLHVASRKDEVQLQHVLPALWGSGDKLGVQRAIVERVPWKVGVSREDEVKIKYWSPSKSTFYSANLFMLRRGQLDTQYVLAIQTGEPAVSNVWLPLKVKQGNQDIVNKLLVFMNSTFGFLHLLGERLETRGLWVEYKKQYLTRLPLPDLRNVPSVPDEILEILKDPNTSLPRFRDFLKVASELSKSRGLTWDRVAIKLIEDRGGELAVRARLDLEVYRWLTKILKVEPPEDLYIALYEEVKTLEKIMESSDEEEEVIEDVEDVIRKRDYEKGTPLDRWFK